MRKRRLRKTEKREAAEENGHTQQKLRGSRRKLYVEEIYNLYSSVYIIRLIKSRWERWVWHKHRET
jgi:hypothetical protein